MLRFIVPLVLLGCRGGDDSDTDTDLPDRFAAIREAVARDLARNHADRASIAVWLDGEIVHVGGFAEGARSAPGPDTLFMIGSDTKKITALSLLRHVAAGRATLDTEVRDALPDLAMQRAPGFAGATVVDLLAHRGGVVDGAQFGTETTDAALYDYAHGPFARDAWPLLPTGLAYNYSNPNFSIAGLVDQQLAGAPWPEVVRSGVLAPLGMDRTAVRKAEVDADHASGIGRAYPSDPEIGPVPLHSTWESAYTRPAGLLWSTPSDQMRLARFLVDGDPDVLPDALRAELLAPREPLYPDLDAGSYGLGIISGRGIRLDGRYYDVAVWAHGGNTLTHTSAFYVLPEHRFAIAILSNGVGDQFDQTVVAAVASLVELPPATQAPTPPFDVDALDALAGRYFDPYNVGEMIVTREGDELRADMPTLDAFGVPYEPEMTPLSTRVWTMTIQGQVLDLAFIDGPGGSLWLRNRSFVLQRQPAQGLLPDDRPTPTREALDRWLRSPELWSVPALLRPPPVERPAP